MASFPSTDGGSKEDGGGKKVQGEESVSLNKEKIVARFMNLAQEKLTTSADSIFGFSLSGDENKQEKELLSSLTSPLCWGMGTSLAVFASFRLGKVYTVSRGFQLSRRTLDRKEDAREQLNNVLSVPFDLGLSLFLGASAGMFLFDTDRVRKDVAQIPLVPGLSRVSDAICPDMIQEYKRYPASTWDPSSAPRKSFNPNYTDVNLETIHTFVTNCRKRSTFEKMLKEADQLDTGRPISIPQPGVPHSIEIEDDDVQNDSEVEGEQFETYPSS